MIRVAVRVLRRRAAGDSGVAMLMALFVIAMLATVSLAIAGITLSQAEPTRLDDKSARVVETAQAGIQTALSQIRGANNGTGTGDSTQLPCSLTGNINSPASASKDLTYTDTIYYLNYLNNPVTSSANNLDNNTWLAANQLSCTPGKGLNWNSSTSTYATGPATVPWYAVIVAAGTGPKAGSNAQFGDRSLRTMYTFTIINTNIPGGPVLVFPTASNLCLDGALYPGGTIVKAGNPVQIKTCNGGVGQGFSYTQDLTLQVSATTPTGTLLCVQNPNTAGDNTVSPALTAAQVVTKPATTAVLKVCDSGLPSNTGVGDDWSEQWSFDGDEQFVGSQIDTSDTSGLCLVTSASTPVDGSAVTIQKCPNTSYTNASSWHPNSSVGAGAAGAALNQLVNYQYFGNCLDVPDGDAGKGFLIGYVCKQNPKPSNVASKDGNQVFVPTNPSGQGQLQTSFGSTYCLQTPSATNPATPGDIVNVATCSQSGGSNQQWTYSGGTKGDGHYNTDYEYQPATSTTGSLLCLTLTMPAPNSFVTAHAAYEDAVGNPVTGYNLQQWGYASVQTCTGADNQKWNAPAGANPAAVTGTFEQPNQ